MTLVRPGGAGGGLPCCVDISMTFLESLGVMLILQYGYNIWPIKTIFVDERNNDLLLLTLSSLFLVIKI